MLAEGMTEPANTWHILELKISSLCHLRHANLDPPGQGWVRCPVRPTKGPYCRVGRGLLFGAFSGVILKDFNPRKLEQVRPVEFLKIHVPAITGRPQHHNLQQEARSCTAARKEAGTSYR